MLASQRHSIILELLQKEGTVHTADLVRRMNVSSETVRKDLDSLEQSGRLTRVGSGAFWMRVSLGETGIFRFTLLLSCPGIGLVTPRISGMGTPHFNKKFKISFFSLFFN